MHWFNNYAAETEWAAFLDLDEFLALPDRDNVLQFLTPFPPECDSIHFHWIYYGTSWFEQRPQGSVLRQYVMREAKVSHETKSMIRAGRVRPALLRPHQTPFWHLWDKTQQQELRSYHSLGEAVPTPFDRRRVAAERADEIRRTGYVAHFAMKSKADFKRRLDRGLGGQFEGQRIWAETSASGHADAFLAATNAEQDLYLKSYWERIVGTPEATFLIAEPRGINVAVGQPATQSSTCAWSKHSNPQNDAAGAISGTVTGRPTFSTGEDEVPWWKVDLAKVHRVHEIRLFNRVDDLGVASRNNNIIVEIALDEQNWQPIYARNSNVPFGGADGKPLILRPDPAVTLRHLRLSLPERTWFALDQVQIYGEEDVEQA